MNQFEGRTAVVTGAASGIGRALAARCAAERMQVVMADIEAEALESAAAALAAEGATVHPVVTDVADEEAVEALAAATERRFGGTHLLFNNAGVGTVGPPIWAHTPADWRWTLDVNLWGVIHGIRAFVPRMLAGGEEGHIVNTASAAGLVAPRGFAPYTVSKWAVVAMSETLHHELAERGAPIGVSVLCPGLVDTAIADAARNRPAARQNQPDEAARQEREYRSVRASLRHATRQGMAAEDLAALVFEGIRNKQFYLLPHPWVKRVAADRLRALLDGNPPPAVD